MSKKVKCSECSNMMNWSLPVKVGEQNIDYARHCLAAAKRSIVCGWTMKTKNISNEQYCKYFKKGDGFHDSIKKIYKSDINNLETMIKEYEDSIKLLEEVVYE